MIQTLTPETIPAKFRPFLIQSPLPHGTFENMVALKGDYIFQKNDWIIKLPRADGLNTTPDTHLYRIRKAEKIRTYIHQNELQDCITVPKKYLYWNETAKQFYVLAEKLDLSLDVAKPASNAIESAWTTVEAVGGQLKALADGADKRSLTPIQAKALAELSVLGYTDLSYNNLYFTKDGQVAIIDTEPQKRFLKKTLKSNFFFFLFGDKGSLLSQQSIAGIAKLKLYTDDPVALQEVQRVERNHAIWSIAQLIIKISAVILTIYFVSNITTRLPIPILATSIKIGFAAFASFKNYYLINNVISVYTVWDLSHQGLEGVKQIVKMETEWRF